MHTSLSHPLLGKSLSAIQMLYFSNESVSQWPLQGRRGARKLCPVHPIISETPLDSGEGPSLLLSIPGHVTVTQYEPSQISPRSTNGFG